MSCWRFSAIDHHSSPLLESIEPVDTALHDVATGEDRFAAGELGSSRPLTPWW
jgi:hypothetical protein